MVGVQCLKLFLFNHSELYADINNGLKDSFSDFDVIVARCIGGGVSRFPEYQGVSLVELPTNIETLFIR
jgi:hypothetical protein